MDSKLYKTLKAIAEGYPITVKHDRYIIVENPEFKPDNGDDIHLVIDINDYNHKSSSNVYRFPTQGDLMRFINRNGYINELQRASDIFDANRFYIVEKISIGKWETKIKFVGINGWWNSVMFEIEESHYNEWC